MPMNFPQTERVFLSIVIPAYNEEARIGQTLRRIREYLSRQNYIAEIIVVDDGSRDLTGEKAGEALQGMKRARLIGRSRNLGKGRSVAEGVLEAEGALVLFTDADLSTPIEELDGFLPWIREGFDVVIGSRAYPESDIQVRQNHIRELMGKTFNTLVRFLVMEGIPDTQCGFKLFRGEVARLIFPLIKTNGFSFDVEVLYLCRRSGYKIKQVPVCWRNSPPSKVRMIKSSAQMFLELVKIRRRHGTKGRISERQAS